MGKKTELELIVMDIIGSLGGGYCPACGGMQVKEYKTFFYCRGCGYQVWKCEIDQIVAEMMVGKAVDNR